MVEQLEGEEIYGAAQGQMILGEQGESMELTREAAQRKFRHFIREFRLGNNYIYRDQIIANVNRGEYTMILDIDDLMASDTVLGHQLRVKPGQFIPVFEDAIREAYLTLQVVNHHILHIPPFQLQLKSEENPRMLRNLNSDLIGHLVAIPGIITAASKPYIKSTSVTHELVIGMTGGMGGGSVPRGCQNSDRIGGERCQMGSYVIVAEKCHFVEQQSLKLQESPEMIPTGEMPRTFILTAGRYLVDQVTPGTRVRIMAIYSIMGVGGTGKGEKLGQNVKVSYLEVKGIEKEESSGGKRGMVSGEDEERILRLGRDPDIYKKITRSIGSAIYGNEEIKRAVACLLFGGSAKHLPDNTHLRGDINVLLLGDPSTAKSQMLKFTERVAPIAVYTSGKGSSAAGLTASVIRDKTSGEFQLEGGAMVLADGGVVCIDEFDKMREQDRVAIHEAMEQQTISIAKAGITTILNSRCSVLAAANPIEGRYDDLRQAAEQIDFKSTILSRFDCIFIVRDIRSEATDRRLAEHVVGLHMAGGGGLSGISRVGAEEHRGQEEISVEDLRKYIYYARRKVFPRLNEEAGRVLENFYVNDRKTVSEQNRGKQGSGMPLTVRQLEAIIRLSEALAKMRLSNQVTTADINEAHRIFQVSTMDAATSSMETNVGAPGEIKDLVFSIEEAIKRRLPIGAKISHQKLSEEMTNRFTNITSVNWAILNMVKRAELVHKEGRKTLIREK